MRSALLAALLLAGAALAASESAADSASKAPSATVVGEGREPEPEQEEESDTAPFMIVVEHASGRRCGGSLVSLRTALTSAWCAGGDGDGGAPRELWALSPGAGAARRVARVALAAGADAAHARGPPAWAGAAHDLAVLELEAPFGGGARSRPILMATQPAECAAGATCHVVRAMGPGREPRLRIVDAALVVGDACGSRSPGWPGLRDTALCLVGPTLCSSDWGAGVVCEGKLCGVLSRSARAAGESGGAGGADESCGDAHVAQSIPRWRRFLHCAHTLRACGRGGDCGQLCSEQRLLDADADSTTLLATESSHEETEASADTETSADIETSADTEPPTLASLLPTPTHALSMPRPVRPSSLRAPGPTRSAPPSPPQPVPQSSAQASPRPAFEFEPNRPDFKAGEYGDNAADYGGSGGEDGGAASSPTAAHDSSTPPLSGEAPNAAPAFPRAALNASEAGAGSEAPRTGSLQARVALSTARSRAAPLAALPAYIVYVLVAIINLAN